MAAGAAGLYLEEVSEIAALSGQGSLQLGADLEYFINVLSALAVQPSAELLTWQARLILSSSDKGKQVLCQFSIRVIEFP